MLCPVPYMVSQAPAQPVHICTWHINSASFVSDSLSVCTNYNMNKQGRSTKTEISDFSEQFSDFDCDSASWLSSTKHSQKEKAIENLRRDHKVKKNNILEASVSAEELKIRGEMEKEIEKDLEEEIREGIYHLALRLHRLYQHQKERNVKEASESGYLQDNRSKSISEVTISIRMEEGTKIEIKQAKKEADERVHPRSSRSENVKDVPAFNAKKFDWAKTLRAGSGPAAVDRANYSSKQLFNGKGNATVEKKLLQLGWKV
ncbi:hypothetical protein L6164_027317 [Bauhinia variegata]|uniref:Uncharacterized protein n=1 Tax=Bauhinia variegata TaxID=167791 RepID=A0ACB9LU92_BAUVA|nr:hypothetical protein L6164_027317 [Bauhinia variegata]